MNLYLLRRRGVAADATELGAGFTRLRAVEAQAMRPRACWLASYALREVDGRFGLACVFEADGLQALREHAQATGLAIEEALPIAADRVAREPRLAMLHLVRRCQAWADAREFDASLIEMRRVAEESRLAHRLEWLRSYAVREDNGRLGSYCLYQSVDRDALLEHAALAGVTVTEITPVLGRVVFSDRRFAPGQSSDPVPG